MTLKELWMAYLNAFDTPEPKVSTRNYGWHKSNKPTLHPRYEIPEHHLNAANLPTSVDLQPECPPVYDQGNLGSCTANAICGLIQFLLIKLGLPSFVPSRLMLYWGERALEGNKMTDSGANGDDGFTFAAVNGVCKETTWPYDVAKFTVIPSTAAWSEATRCRLSDPVTIANGDLTGIKSRLASGYPVAFGFTVYPALESEACAKTGILTMPKKGENPLGGHEVLLVGYNDSTQMLKVRNSWGPGWGIDGYFFMPYAYAINPNLASDFRSASKVS